MLPRPLLFALVLLMASTAPGCGRARDCSRLADVVNRRGAEIAGIDTRDSDTPETLAADMKALSQLAGDVAREVETLELDDETLEAQAEQYGKTALDLSEASQSYAALMETLQKHRGAQQKAESDFRSSGQGLLDACATASEACNAVGDVLRNQPENPEPTRLLDLLETYVDGLEALDLREGPVSNAVAMRVAATKAYKALIERGATIDDDIEQARGRIHDAVEKQNSLIDQLNVFCIGEN